MVTRREFARCVTLAAAGMAMTRPMSARQRIPPTIRVIGMAAYRQQPGENAVELYLPQAAGHRPFLFAHADLLSGELTALPTDFPLEKFHRDLLGQRPSDYRVICLAGVRDASVSASTKLRAEVRAIRLAQIRTIAAKVNGKAYGETNPDGFKWTKVTLTGGVIVDAPPTPAPGHTVVWKFKTGLNSSVRCALTDITQFEGDGEEARVRIGERTFDIPANSPHRAWIINMPEISRCRNPAELTHGEHYFEFLKDKQEKHPKKRPSPKAEGAISCGGGGGTPHPCPEEGRSDLKVAIPPDSEFCYQALV